jgi:hypothetical protein
MSTWFRIFCAVGLLALIASPMTAPFSTCSLAQLLNSGADRNGLLLVVPPAPAADDDVKIVVQATSLVLLRPAVIGVGHPLALGTVVRPRHVPSTVIRV